MKHLGDICKINGAEIEPVDCISYGAPCQDLSVAGLRKGMQHEDMGDEETTRSGLFYEAIRVIKEMRDAERNKGRADDAVRPRWSIYENVPGALSSNSGEDWRCVLEATAKIIEEDAVIPEPPKGGWPYAGSIILEHGSMAWRIPIGMGVLQRQGNGTMGIGDRRVPDSRDEETFSGGGIDGDIEKEQEGSLHSHRQCAA